jgi:hypothetical protein
MNHCLACPEKEISNRAKYCAPKCRSLYVTYGIGLADWERMFNAQQGLCAICKQRQRMRALAVDHDHKIGPEGSDPALLRESVRGLICLRCNSQVLDAVRHNAEFALRVYWYLIDPPAKEILNV